MAILIATGTAVDAVIMRDETFGPVAALTPFDTEDEVVARVNDTEYGLVAYVHMQDLKRIYRMSNALDLAWWRSTGHL